MTDNEIIKALEFCISSNDYDTTCVKCPMSSICDDDYDNNALIRIALGLINRQRAEIERLKKENKLLSIDADTAFQDGLNEAQDLYAEQVRQEAKSEAIKEFAEMLKENMRLEDDCDYDCENCFYDCNKYVLTIDKLVKEMTEETNG